MITIALDDLAEIDVTIRCRRADLTKIAARLNDLRNQSVPELCARWIVIAALMADRERGD